MRIQEAGRVGQRPGAVLIEDLERHGTDDGRPQAEGTCEVHPGEREPVLGGDPLEVGAQRCGELAVDLAHATLGVRPLEDADEGDDEPGAGLVGQAGRCGVPGDGRAVEEGEARRFAQAPRAQRSRRGLQLCRGALVPRRVDTTDVLDARLRVAPRSSLGRIRARLLDLRAASPARTTSFVASDFYGPGASMALGGDRVLDPAVTGRPVRPLGRVDLPRAWTFLPDLAAAMVAAGEAPATVAGGSTIVLAPVVHATQRELATAYAREAGRARVRVRPVRAGVLRAAAPFSRSMAAMAEMSYLFTEPLLVDTRASIEDLGVAPTALEDAVRRSVATRVGGPRPAVRAS